MKLRQRLMGAALAVAGAGTALTIGSAVTPAPADAYVYYGAMALSPSTGSVGQAWDYPNSAAAASAALGSCGYTDCRTVIRVSNGCGAISYSSYNRTYGFGAASRLSVAQRNARYYSNGGYIYSWMCTSGHGG